MFWGSNIFNKKMAIVIAIAQLIFGFLFGGFEGFFRVALFLVLPMACIFYSEDIGGATGFDITKKSPAFAVYFMGWVLLLMPMIALYIIKVSSENIP